MFRLFLKRIWRNKWLLVKMFILSPLVSILPIIMINGYTADVSEKRILTMCIWSFMYFSTFESVNMKMKDNTDGKIADILLSKSTLLEKHFIEKIALLTSFLPSFFITLLGYLYIYNLHLQIRVVVYSLIGMIVATIVMMDITLYLELRYKNYFNKFNVCMSLLYILSGILYTLDTLPIGIRIFSYTIPISFLFDYIFTSKVMDLVFFGVTLLIWSILVNVVLIRAEHRFRKLGGRV